MTKRISSPVRRNNGYMRQKTTQQLQMIALIFIVILLSLKIYVRNPLISDDDIITCAKCMSQNDNETIPEMSEIDDETDKDINIQPASHPLPSSDINYDFTVVTGASENHFCPIKSFLYNMKHTLKGFNARIIVYDIGFSSSQHKRLRKLQELGYLTELRSFQWSHYPSFWNISKSRGEYAWKPGMVAEVARDYPGKVVWLDSGTLVERKFFRNLNSLLRKYYGFISPSSSGTMVTWTHPGVYEYYGDDHSKYDSVRNCNGASIAFDTTKTQKLIDDWFKCALVKNCIAPPGSSRENHRQDQAILTYLAAKSNLYCNSKKERLWINTHTDGNCKSYNSAYESVHDINFP